MYKIEKIKTDFFGLKYKPQLIGNNNDSDIIYNNGTKLREFSECNVEKLKYCFSKTIKSILEIGVHRNPMEMSSTGVIFETKSDDAKYIGIDINDKSYLNNKEKNIFTIKADSSNHLLVYELMNKLDIVSFDLIFIDGYHSVNQVYLDWKYVEKLSKNGIVVMHDTNYHPGPYTIFDAVDENIFEKTKHCKKNSDWGISILKRL